METIKYFDKCVWCGVGKGVIGGVVAEEQQKGSIGKGIQPYTKIEVIAIYDPLKPQIAGGRAVAVRIYSDICDNCGRIYTVLIEKGHMTIPSVQGQQPIFT